LFKKFRIKEAKKSGCYKDLIQHIRDDVVLADLIWIPRDKSNEFYNIWKQGVKPEKTGISPGPLSDQDRKP